MPKYYFGNYLQKPKYYFGNYLQKPTIILATIYKKPNIILATIYRNPNTIKSPSTILGNILSKAQVWQNFTNTQKPKYYPWQYFIKSPTILKKFCKSPNTILAKFYKSPILFWQHFINSPKLLLF